MQVIFTKICDQNWKTTEANVCPPINFNFENQQEKINIAVLATYTEKDMEAPIPFEIFIEGYNSLNKLIFSHKWSQKIIASSKGWENINEIISEPLPDIILSPQSQEENIDDNKVVKIVGNVINCLNGSSGFEESEQIISSAIICFTSVMYEHMMTKKIISELNRKEDNIVKQTMDEENINNINIEEITEKDINLSTNVSTNTTNDISIPEDDVIVDQNYNTELEFDINSKEPPDPRSKLFSSTEQISGTSLMETFINTDVIIETPSKEFVIGPISPGEIANTIKPMEKIHIEEKKNNIKKTELNPPLKIYHQKPRQPLATQTFGVSKDSPLKHNENLYIADEKKLNIESMSNIKKLKNQDSDNSKTSSKEWIIRIFIIGIVLGIAYFIWKKIGGNEDHSSNSSRGNSGLSTPLKNFKTPNNTGSKKILDIITTDTSCLQTLKSRPPNLETMTPPVV